MRGMFGGFFGMAKRNGLVRLENPHPVEDYGTKCVESGDAGRDGFTVLSRANPNAQGSPPPVKGVEGPIYSGPDQSFEQ